MHVSITPSILYLGTPVVLNSTVNENGSYNLAPISSAIWLGWRCLLGFEAVSKTPQNMIRTGECVINLPSAGQVGAWVSPRVGGVAARERAFAVVAMEVVRLKASFEQHRTEEPETLGPCQRCRSTGTVRRAGTVLGMFRLSPLIP